MIDKIWLWVGFNPLPGRPTAISLILRRRTRLTPVSVRAAADAQGDQQLLLF